MAKGKRGGVRLDFELDHEVGIGPITAHGGVAVLLEHFRASGAASVVDGEVPYKLRKRGLSASQMVESLLALWASGGEPCEDLARLKDDGLALLLGHVFPAAQTARDFLERFEEADLPLLGGGASAVPQESQGLWGLGLANRALIADIQPRSPERASGVAAIDLDATIAASSKRVAKFAYDGQRGYQPVLAPWAEQDPILEHFRIGNALADEFRDGNVSASSGNRRVIEQALAALPPGVDEIYLRADSALYDHDLMAFLDRRRIGFAISAMVSKGPRRRMLALDEAAWNLEHEDGGVCRHWAELDYCPDGALIGGGGRGSPPALHRLTRKQGELFADGSKERHFCMVTNRADPEDGDAGDLLHWRRGKAGTVG